MVYIEKKHIIIPTDSTRFYYAKHTVLESVTCNFF